MITKVNLAVFSAVLVLFCGCVGYDRGITYSVLVDRVEDGMTVVVVHLQLDRGMSWYGADAKQRAILVAERVVRLELARDDITDYTMSVPTYVQFRQNSHRVGMRIKEGSGHLAKNVGKTIHGTLKATAVQNSP
jgi:hypothetical protein